MHITDELLRERVERGVEFLDADFPDWRSRIDTRTLDLTSQNNCVLGQLLGDFRDGLEMLGITIAVSRTLGFNYEHQPAGWLGPLPGPREAEADEAERLRRLWVEEIDREPSDVEIYGAGCK